MNKQLSPLYKRHIINLASKLLSLGGMEFAEENALASRLYEALTRACDHSGAHEEAIELVWSIIPNFDY